MTGLRMFDQAELAQLIGGEDKLIDMDDLQNFTYVSGYANDKTINAFWKVVKSFNQQQRRGLIKFVTSCARPPLYVLFISFRRSGIGMNANDRLGFAHLNPQFGIRFGGNDKTRLPSACTSIFLEHWIS
jgi:ubiquitin-protein ligase E3 C